MIWRKVVVIFTFLVSDLFSHHSTEKHVSIDEHRYKDLLEDDFNKRVLGAFFHPGYNHGGYIYSEKDREDLEWFYRQRAKLFPVLIEVLRRESSSQVEEKPSQWRSVEKKEHVLSMAMNFSEGDPQPFVEEIRRQLPEWSERQIANHDTHTGFIREALDLLAREGDESDIPLIESFLEDVNRNNKHNAEKSLTKLKDRLAAEQKRSPRTPRKNNLDERRNREPSSRSNEKSQSQEEIAESKKSSLPWIIAGVLLAGILALLLRNFKGKSTS